MESSEGLLGALRTLRSGVSARTPYSPTLLLSAPQTSDPRSRLRIPTRVHVQMGRNSPGRPTLDHTQQCPWQPRAGAGAGERTHTFGVLQVNTLPKPPRLTFTILKPWGFVGSCLLSILDHLSTGRRGRDELQ